MQHPDVRWEGCSHQQILDIVNTYRPDLTDTLEAGLRRSADALAETADRVTATLRRVDAGEWTGSAATAAREAMRVLRDFDDTMRHRSTLSDIAASGQTGSAGWARASVPPLVAAGPEPTPVGRPIDILIAATDDYQEQLAARKEAEIRARQVMRDYTAMTIDRIEAMPPLPQVPQVVLNQGGAELTGSGPASGGDPGRVDQPAPTSTPVPRRVGGAADAGPVGGDGGDSGPGRAGVDPGGGPPAPRPAEPSGGAVDRPDGTEPAAVPGTPAAPVPGDGGTRVAAAAGGSPLLVDGVLTGGGRSAAEPDLGTRPPTGGPDPRPGAPGAPGARAGGRVLVPVESPVRGALARTPAPAAPAPLAAPGAAARDEDRERRARYGTGNAALFEPDNDDGLLHDPYRDGSYVAPATIGDDEDD